MCDPTPTGQLHCNLTTNLRISSADLPEHLSRNAKKKKNGMSYVAKFRLTVNTKIPSFAHTDFALSVEELVVLMRNNFL